MATDCLLQVRRNPLKVLLAKAFFRSRYLLLQKRKLSRPVIETIRGIPIIVLPDVLNPRVFLSGSFFCDFLGENNLPAGSSVLDLGTGSGCCAVVAAASGSIVTAVDINPHAVRCARLNVILNGLETQIETLPGDLFEPVSGKRFDVILFNPPFFPGRPATEFERSWCYDDLPDRFASAAADHLLPDGCVFLLLSSSGRCEVWLDALMSRRFLCSQVASRDYWSEKMFIFRVTPPSASHAD